MSDPDDPFLRAMHGVARLRAVQEWASGELSAALTLTGVAADRQLALAVTVVTRLPEVHAALSAGRSTCPRRACSPIHDIDPTHARRRYHRAVRDRAVIGYLRPDGTVTVSATGLPAGEAAVACERLDVLAAAAQRAGHPGRAAQIQTDLFLGMLDGSFHHLTEAQIMAVAAGPGVSRGRRAVRSRPRCRGGTRGTARRRRAGAYRPGDPPRAPHPDRARRALR